MSWKSGKNATEYIGGQLFFVHLSQRTAKVGAVGAKASEEDFYSQLMKSLLNDFNAPIWFARLFSRS